MHSRRRVSVVAVVSVLGVTMLGTTGCGAGSGEGNVLYIGTTQNIPTLNPFGQIGAQTPVVMQQIYPSLFQYDRDLNIVGDFAKSWEFRNHGRALTVHTVPDGEWSDGEPLTARDAAWTIRTIIRYADGPTSAFASAVRNISTVATPDADTLVVRYRRPVADALAQLKRVTVLPRHVWQQYAVADGKGLTRYANPAPVVSGGPFTLESYHEKEAAVFEANPNWYGPRPSIDGFGLKIYGTDDAMVSAVRNGDIDYIQQVPPTAVRALEGADVVVESIPGQTFDELIFNSNPYRQEHPEIQDPRVRQAVAHAIDYDEVVQVAWLGNATPGSSVVAPALSSWNDPALKTPSYDPDRANTLLDRAGYKRGAEGIRIAGDHPMSYSVIFPDEQSGPGDRTFQIMKANLGAIGIEIRQQRLDNAAAFEAITAPDGKYLDFDLAFWSWQGLEDPSFILSVFLCDQWGNLSDSAYCNEHYDELYVKQQQIVNPRQRRRIVFELQRMIYRDKPYVVIDYRNVIEAHSDEWAGFVPSPQGSVNFLSKETLLSVHRTD